MTTTERFVIIDDDAINNIKCRFVINKVIDGAEIFTFLSGREGLDFLKVPAPKQVQTFVFLDINMPGMNGWEALDHFEIFDEKIKSRIKLFMLSSSVDPVDINRAKAIPRIIEYIIKPFSIEIFDRIMAEYK